MNDYINQIQMVNDKIDLKIGHSNKHKQVIHTTYLLNNNINFYIYRQMSSCTL